MSGVTERRRGAAMIRHTIAAAPHADDIAVDIFAGAMKVKLAAARRKGRSGWDDPAQCSAARLQGMLAEHMAKGDPVDVGNFAMMLFNRRERTEAPAYPCWSCTRLVTMEQRSGADGACPHCAKELDLQYWPAAKAGTPINPMTT